MTATIDSTAIISSEAALANGLDDQVIEPRARALPGAPMPARVST